MTMQLKEFDIELDLKKDTKNADVTVVQHDTKTNVFNIKILDFGKLVHIPADQYIKAAFQDRTKKIVVQEDDISINNNIIRIILNNKVVALHDGDIKMEIILETFKDEKIDKRLTTFTFQFKMIKGIYEK